MTIFNKAGGSIITRGDGAFGIQAQSLGGGFNAGYYNPYADQASGQGGSGTKSAGAGSNGGRANKVHVQNEGHIETFGNDAAAIHAQSLGGLAGDGGRAERTGFFWAMALGGAGGNGGAGGEVHIDGSHAGQSITTHGESSPAIFAQSLGGRGSGGFAKANSYGIGISVSVAVGGSGGTGGTGGPVNIWNTNTIRTEGMNSAGVFAQSIGGGHAGSAKSGATAISGGDIPSISLAVTVGGSGGAAGNGGDIYIRNNAPITTFGVNSYGLYAQSIGGGSSGAAGGGAITIETHTGTIATSGNGAHAVMAQSIGGGGGNAGDATSRADIYGFGDGKGGTLTLTVGGDGSGGGAGGAVTITSGMDAGGLITTGGDTAYGIFAQSIGGGGGNGGQLGVAKHAAPDYAGQFISQLKKIVGYDIFKEWADKNGYTDDYEMLSKIADIVDDTGLTDPITEKFKEVIIEKLELSDLAKRYKEASKKYSDKLEEKEKGSITANVGVGGSGGDGGMSYGSVITNRASIQTKGNIAHGIYAQSVGVGGSGGNAASVGGSVSLTNSGNIGTIGDVSYGIIAQSVGGGGGLAAGAASSETEKFQATFNIGGSGGKGGGGNWISVANTGNITTSGREAHAIVAQSIGGGGGYLGRVPKTSDLVSSENTSGNGGHVTIQMGNANNHAYINTSGKGAHGIFAQSIGGGGGTWTNVDDYYTLEPGRSGVLARPNASGNGGNIDINYNGSIHANGHYAYAILAQSGKQTDHGTIDPNSTGGRIHITLDGGNFVGGWGAPGRDLTSAIRIDGGAKGSDDSSKNIITIGPDAHVYSASNVAILAYAGGNEMVYMNGRLSGDVLLTDNAANTTETNTFRVQGAGYYTSRSGQGAVTLGQVHGSGANFFDVWNGGTVDVGGVNNISTLTVSGGLNFEGGKLLVDVNASTTGVIRNDNIDVYGGPIYLQQGNGSPTVITPNVVTGLLKRDYQIFNKAPDAAKALSVNVAANPGSPITWTSTYSGQSITPEADFVGSATSQGIPLTTAQRTMLTNLQTVWDDPKQTSLANLFGIAAREIHSTAQYAEAINRLDASQYSSTAAAETNGAKVSLKAPLSCPIFVDAGVTLGETQCVWGRISGAFAKNKSSDGYKQDEFSYRIGAQWEIAPDWFLGVSGSYFSSTLEGNGGHMSSDGKGGNIAAALKRQMGPWLFAVSGHFGYGSYDTNHQITIGGQNWFTKANSDVWTGALGFRASYELALGNFYVRPAVDLDIIHTYMPGFVSKGNFPYAYHFGDMKEWSFLASPFVEVGTRIDISEKTWLRPFASIGATFMHESDLDRKVSFGHEAPRFTVTHAMDQHYLDLGAGLQLFSNDQLELRAEYKAKIGENYTRHEASGRMSIKF